MEDQIKHWDKESLVAYIMIHAANADFEIDSSEKNIILSMVSPSVFEASLVEYQKDNDAQGLKKILAAKEYLNLSKDDSQSLLDEIEKVFNADGNYDILEHNMFKGIRKLLL